MSDDQAPIPTQPNPTQPHPTQPYPPGRAIQPYAQPAPPPQPYAPPYPPLAGAYSHAVVAPRVGSAHVVIAWVLTVLTLGYFLPWAVAATRQRSNTLAIGLLNFLVGWTLIGWIAALVMAVMSEPTQVTNVAYAVAPVLHIGPPAPPPPGWYPDQHGGRRYWDGARWTEHTSP